MVLLGVKIDELNLKNTLEKIGLFLDASKKNTIFTPNPEMLVKSVGDSYFKDVLNSGSLNVCDGFGIYLVSRIRKIKLDRIAGVDLMLSMCESLASRQKKVYLLGGGNSEVASAAAKVLISRYPELFIVGYDAGPQIIEEMDGSLRYDLKQNESIIGKINAASPDVIFVAFGMGKQEKWLYENLDKLTNVKIGMGVGGAFDYISGQVSRAPLLLRKIGLEWAYRLIRQPKRLFRIYRATIKFIYLVIAERKV